MANIKSAIKRNRQNEKRRLRNKPVRTAVRSIIKKTRAAVEGDNLDEARECLKIAERTIAKAARRHLYHPRNASRKISRLHAMVNKAAAAK